MNRDDGMVFLRAGLIALFVVFACAAFAAEKPFDCNSVRAFVAEHGKAKALIWALENGATWKQIREARRCLK